MPRNGSGENVTSVRCGLEDEPIGISVAMIIYFQPYNGMTGNALRKIHLRLSSTKQYVFALVSKLDSGTSSKTKFTKRDEGKSMNVSQIVQWTAKTS